MRWAYALVDLFARVPVGDDRVAVGSRRKARKASPETDPGNSEDGKVDRTSSGPEIGTRSKNQGRSPGDSEHPHTQLRRIGWLAGRGRFSLVIDLLE